MTLAEPVEISFAEEVYAYREFHECGLEQAKRAVKKRRRDEKLTSARSRLDILHFPGRDPVIDAIVSLIDLMLEDE